MPSFSGFGLHNDAAMVIGLGFAVLALVIHIFFAIAVFNDAAKREEEKKQLWFVNQWLWAGATLIGGLVAAAIYWAMHYSTLSRES